MSEDNQADNTCCCASCGTAEVDDIKLMDCDGCDLVKYCSDECQQLHRPEHEEECKKRVAELRDELLFKQPESSHRGDCPICTLPLYGANFVLTSCCFKSICQGCSFGVNRNTCPFCREPVPKTEEDRDKLRMKRIEANDPVALRQEGGVQNKKGEYRSAFEYYTKAAELGDVEAHYELSFLYHDGKGVEKDEEKTLYHTEEAAIGGHPHARFLLGCLECYNGQQVVAKGLATIIRPGDDLSTKWEWEEKNHRHYERAVKHWIIAAAQGEDDAIETLMKKFKHGFLEREVLATALRAHHAAVDATKSLQRKAAEDWSRMKKEAKG